MPLPQPKNKQVNRVFKFDEILDAVCEITYQDRAEVLSPLRSPEIVFAKILLVGFSRELEGRIAPGFGSSSPTFIEIGDAFGWKRSWARRQYLRWKEIDEDKRQRLRLAAVSRVYKGRYQALVLSENMAGFSQSGQEEPGNLLCR